MKKRWLFRDVSLEKVFDISKNYKISPLISRILAARNIEDINEFITKTEFYDPFLLKDMDKAVDVIDCVLSAGKKIVIYGDYDVDGITSTSILVKFFKSIGGEVDYYIPDRLHDGYGLNNEAIEKIKNAGAGLIITVDCGITAIKEVEYANSIELPIVITDHHECKEELPPAAAVINPKRPDCEYCFKGLAGVGVAFKLLTALSLRFELDIDYNPYIELVTIGTIADIVPLVSENRLIVKQGLKIMPLNKSIDSLMRVARQKKISSSAIAYMLAPRLNAIGRIGDANKGVEFLLSENQDEIEEAAVFLNEQNKLRQDSEQLIFNEACEMIESQEQGKMIILTKEGWQHGIIGIVSSRLVEKYYKPVLLITIEGGFAKGSGRSVKGFHLFKLFQKFENLLEKYGGHELAAGLTMKRENLELFVEQVLEYAEFVIEKEILIPFINVDCKLDFEDISIKAIKELSILEPFGMKNPTPVFCFENIKILSANHVNAAGKHIRFMFSSAGKEIEGIFFNMGHILDNFKEGQIIDVVCTLEINEFNDIPRMQLNIKDFKIKESLLKKKDFFDSFIPDRNDIKVIYQYIKSRAKDNIYRDNIKNLALKISDSYKVSLEHTKIFVSIQVLNDIGLLEFKINKLSIEIIFLEPKDKKSNIENSDKLQFLKQLNNLNE